MDTGRDRPWMCHKCGYAMECYSPADDGRPAIAKPGDVSLCMNCGALYTRQGDAWRPMHFLELAGQPLYLRLELARVEAARRAVITRDLSKKPGRA